MLYLGVFPSNVYSYRVLGDIQLYHDFFSDIASEIDIFILNENNNNNLIVSFIGSLFPLEW